MTFAYAKRRGRHRHLAYDPKMPVVLANEDGSYVAPRKRSSASLVVLSDELTPSQISAALRLTPDRWWLRGEFESHPSESGWQRSRPHPHNAWTLESQLPETAEPEDHLADLLDRIGVEAKSVASLAFDPRVHSVRLWLVLNIDNANPGIELKPPLVDRLATLGASLAIDVYVDLADEVIPRDWQVLG